MRIGIGSYSVPWHIGIGEWTPQQPLQHEGLLALAHELRVEVVQYCDNLPLDTLDEARLDRLHAQAQEWGIALEIGTRGLEQELLQRCVQLAVRFSSPFVRVVVDTPNYHPSPEQLVDDLRRLKPVFTDAGVKIAIENHDRFPVQVLRQVIEEVLCPYVLNLHVKDVRTRRESHILGFRIEGTPVGQGSVDVEEVVRRVRAANPQANAIIELWTPPQESLSATIALERRWLEQSVHYLRSLF
jgi:sugar phosphate isomerase/epimerase